MEIKTIGDIQDAYEHGGYTADYPHVHSVYEPDSVFDLDKSVRWNREKAQSENGKRNAAIREYKEKQAQLDKNLDEDVVATISACYGLPTLICVKIWDYVFEKYHSCMSDTFNNLYDICDLCKKSYESALNKKEV
jgi:hypothetical protein